MAFTSVLGAVLGAATKLSEITKVFNNTLWNKDKILGDNAEGSGAGAHFHDFSATVSEGVSSTTSGTYVNKVTHTFTPQVAGDYMIQYQFETTNSAAAGEVDAQVDLDAGTIIAQSIESPNTGGDYELHSGFDIQTLDVSAHTVEIDFLRPGAIGTASIRRARVSTWRVG